MASNFPNNENSLQKVVDMEVSSGTNEKMEESIQEKNDDTEQPIKSALSRQASSSSTDSKKNKRVTFHPSVGDSDQEISEYLAKHEYIEDHDDVYDGFDDTSNEANTRRYPGTSYNDIKRAAAVLALRRSPECGEGEGDGERAHEEDRIDVDYGDDDTIVNEHNSSFVEINDEGDDSIYADEYVYENVDSDSDEYMEQLEDVELPPDLQGVDPYLLASMLEEIQEQQNREGSPTGRSSYSSEPEKSESIEDFIEEFTIQVLEDAALGLYEYFKNTIDLESEHVEKEQKVLHVDHKLENIQEEDEENLDTSSAERRLSSGLIEKQNLVDNLHDIIEELDQVEKAPSESSLESGAILNDNDSPEHSTPLLSPEPKLTALTLTQTLKGKADFSFYVTEGDQSLFEGDLFDADQTIIDLTDQSTNNVKINQMDTKKKKVPTATLR